MYGTGEKEARIILSAHRNFGLFFVGDYVVEMKAGDRLENPEELIVFSWVMTKT
jgi:hypothetical protein